MFSLYLNQQLSKIMYIFSFHIIELQFLNKANMCEEWILHSKLSVPRRCFFCGSFLLCLCYVCICYAVLTFPFSPVFACWKRALVCCVILYFVTFPYCVLGQVWYLIVSIPDICLPLNIIRNNKTKCHRRCLLKAIHYNNSFNMKDTLL